jgi:hypothetical protein
VGNITALEVFCALAIAKVHWRFCYCLCLLCTGPIQSDTTVCYKCCLKEFQEAVFCYRKDILVEDLPGKETYFVISDRSF